MVNSNNYQLLFIKIISVIVKPSLKNLSVDVFFNNLSGYLCIGRIFLRLLFSLVIFSLSFILISILNELFHIFRSFIHFFFVWTNVHISFMC